MRINKNTNLMSIFSNQRIESKQATTKYSLSLGKRDSYVHGSDNLSCIYNANVGLWRGRATSSVLDTINFNYLDIMKQRCDKQFELFKLG